MVPEMAFFFFGGACLAYFGHLDEPMLSIFFLRHLAELLAGKNLVNLRTRAYSICFHIF